MPVGSARCSGRRSRGPATGSPAPTPCSDASRARAADLLPGVPLADVATVVAGAELVLLAVPDDALAHLVARAVGDRRLAGRADGGAHQRPARAWPCSSPRRAHHVLPLALHPAMTFTGTAMDLDRLADCAFGVTTDEALRPVAEALVMEMGGDPVWVAEEDRVAYHAALAHGANHLVTLTSEAMELLSRAGVDEPRRVVGPLMRAALDNALRLGDAALTGPVARGDVGTVEDHLRELDRLSPEIRRTYVALARATALRALDSGRLRPAAAEPLLDILADQEH